MGLPKPRKLAPFLAVTVAAFDRVLISGPGLLPGDVSFETVVVDWTPGYPAAGMSTLAICPQALLVSWAGHQPAKQCRGVVPKLSAETVMTFIVTKASLPSHCHQAPVGEVMQGFIPKLSADTVVVAAGALGALVMPYNTFFLSHVINGRPKDNGTDGKKRVLLR